MKYRHLTHIILEEENKDDDDDPANLPVKIASIAAFIIMTLVFGLMPYCIKKCRKSTKFLSISNSFAGGLFLGIGLFHVLPDSAETLKNEYKDIDLPFAYFGAYISYALILFVEKVAFNSHSLLHNNQNNNNNKNTVVVEPMQNFNINYCNSQEEIKDINLIKKESINNQADEEEENEEGLINDNPPQKKSWFGPYALLLALGFHGFFEGMALGIQGKLRNTLFLSLAIAAHKWAASLTLGISFIKGGAKLKQLVISILIFGLIGPAGIALGIILSETCDEVVEAFCCAITVGTFIYIACTEVLVEEFENSEYKYVKFIMFMIGGIFTAGLALMEEFTDPDD